MNTYQHSLERLFKAQVAYLATLKLKGYLTQRDVLTAFEFVLGAVWLANEHKLLSPKDLKHYQDRVLSSCLRWLDRCSKKYARESGHI